MHQQFAKPALPARMMTLPLLISSLLEYAARHAGTVEIVSKRVEGDIHRYTYGEAELRARKVAQALAALGCVAGDRIGTLAWNGYRHFELYFGASGSELVCHTVNPRLFPEQIEWIINDAGDRVLCFDLNVLPLVESLAPRLRTVEHYVLLAEHGQGRATTLPNLVCYEDLLAAEDGDYAWPQFDENAASSLCYTSGTTGDPKGALYSHRSTLLHPFGVVAPNALDLSVQDAILPLVPMFHANAWGLPYAAPMVGAKLVFAGPHLDGASLYELIEAEGVTMSAGVPTIWQSLAQFARDRRLKFRTLRHAIIGGAVCAPAFMTQLEAEFGIEAVHAWGMTEMSPLGTVSRLLRHHRDLEPSARRVLLATQGRSLFGVDIDIVDADGRMLPWNGEAAGDLLARGHWVIDRYFAPPALDSRPSPLRCVAGREWFPTGDVAAIDPDGYMRITDRSKDVIKSGGEWISSLDLENIAMSHPGVAEAAAIGCAHSKWQERPLLIVVARPGTSLCGAELLRHFDGRIAHWQIPDDVVFVGEIPHTATGKINKLELRRRFADHRLPTD